MPPQGPRPGSHPRPIRASRVWAGIGIAIGSYIAISVLAGLLVSLPVGDVAGRALGVAGIAGPFLVFLAAVVVGIIQLARGDRGIGVGLLIGGAGIPIVLAGVCVAIILALANSGAIG